MKNLRFARLILQPTVGSSLGIVGLALAVMGISGFSYATRSGLFYEYLFGTGSSMTLIETSKSTIGLFNEIVFGNPILNKILFFVFWMIIGLIVYIIISGLGSGAGAAEHAVEESNFIHAEKKHIVSELRLKISLQLIALGLMAMFLVLFYKILLPFGVLSARITAGDLSQPINWLYGLLGFIVLCGSFYLGVVLLRFLLLKPRVFGGWEDVVSDEIENEQHTVE